MTHQDSHGSPLPAGGPAAPVQRSGYLYWVAKVVLTPILTIAFRPKIRGVRNVPRNGPAILACNHVSDLDWLFLPLVVRTRRISFLAKLEYFTRPGLKGAAQRYFFTATGQVPVDRSESDAASAALRTAKRLLDEGRLVGIFPEGTRSRDGRLYRGRTGVARLAAETGVPVIPCATVGVFDIAPPGTKVPRPRQIGVQFGPPMTWPAGRAASPAALRAWTDELMAVIQRLSGQEPAGVDAWG
ncbi:MAG: 1-acyl-sn-glycerol-3-phosphate acyltransferase, partial [Actinomycetota bacterium]|nr:1-acyl-sn-glycerol-3-phosphate acyltransferase [Actinomycetota bacterium]